MMVQTELMADPKLFGRYIIKTRFSSTELPNKVCENSRNNTTSKPNQIFASIIGKEWIQTIFTSTLRKTSVFAYDTERIQCNWFRSLMPHTQMLISVILSTRSIRKELRWFFFERLKNEQTILYHTHLFNFILYFFFYAWAQILIHKSLHMKIEKVHSQLSRRQL